MKVGGGIGSLLLYCFLGLVFEEDVGEGLVSPVGGGFGKPKFSI